MQNLRNSAGFSLIELMVVLTIVGIMLGLLIPNVGGYVAQMEINEATQNVAGAFRKAREIAISKNVSTVVVIDNNTRTYIIYRQPMQGEVLSGTSSSFPSVIAGNNFFPIETQSISIKGNIGIQTKATVNPSGAALVANPSITIGYTSRGSASTDANVTDSNTIYLMPDKEFIQNAQQKMRAITVATATGRIRIYQWSGNTWQ